MIAETATQTAPAIPENAEFLTAVAHLPEPLTRPEWWTLHDLSEGVFDLDHIQPMRWTVEIADLVQTGHLSDLHWLVTSGLVTTHEDGDGDLWCELTDLCLQRADVAAKTLRVVGDGVTLPVCCVACSVERGEDLPAACHLAPCARHQGA